MTLFILHGGGESHGGRKHDNFYKEITEHLPVHANVLVVYFALKDEDIPSRHPTYIEFFMRNNSGKTIELTIATKENFINELRTSDAVYFRGGNTSVLLQNIKRYPDFGKELLKKKVVAGSSAGVGFLGKFHLSSTQGILKGLGILPIKTICHLEKKTDEQKRQLDDYEGELVALKEGEYRIMEYG